MHTVTVFLAITSSLSALIASLCWWKVATIPPFATPSDGLGAAEDGEMRIEIEPGRFLDPYGGLKQQSRWNRYGAAAAAVAALSTAILIPLQTLAT